jgi:O-antigen/teichoic acid export membrane protein
VRAFLRDVSAVYLVNAINGVLGIVFVPVALGRLGASSYGLFSIYSVLASYVVLVELGLGKNLQRILAGHSAGEWRTEQLRIALGLYLSLSALLIALLPVLAILVSRYLFPAGEGGHSAVQWITAATIGEYVLGVPAGLMQTRCIADEQFARYSRYSLTSGLVRYGLSFAAVLVTARPEVVVSIIVSRRILDAVLARRIMGGLPAGSWKPRFNAKQSVVLIRQSSLLSVAQLLQISVVSLGAVLVNWSFGLRALGVYRAVFDLASKMWFFSNTLGLVIFPKFVRMLATQELRVALGRMLPRVLGLSWTCYGVLAIGGALFGPLALGRVGMSGAEFAQLFVLVFAGVTFNAHTNLAYEFTQATGKYATVVLVAALSLTLMVATFLAVRPLYPWLAMGWAWFLSQIVYAIVSDMVVYRFVGVEAPAIYHEAISRGAMLAAVVAVVLNSLRLLPSSILFLSAICVVVSVVCAAKHISAILGLGLPIRGVPR